MTRKVLVLAAAVTVIAGAALWGQSQDDALDPLRVAPDTHKVAFENAFVRVLDVHVPPGKVEPRHRHPHGVTVYLTEWDAKVTADGGTALVTHRTPGMFAWNEAIVHSVENVGKTEGHVLRIELKR